MEFINDRAKQYETVYKKHGLGHGPMAECSICGGWYCHLDFERTKKKNYWEAVNQIVILIDLLLFKGNNVSIKNQVAPDGTTWFSFAR